MSPRRVFTVTTQAVLAAAFAATAVIPAMTHQAPRDSTHLEPGEQYAGRDSLPVNVPTWTPALADRFPACVANDGRLAETVVVIDQGNDAARVSFDEAYAAVTDDEPANDVWIVGVCLVR